MEHNDRRRVTKEIIRDYKRDFKNRESGSSLENTGTYSRKTHSQKTTYDLLGWRESQTSFTGEHDRSFIERISKLELFEENVQLIEKENEQQNLKKRALQDDFKEAKEKISLTENELKNLKRDGNENTNILGEILGEELKDFSEKNSSAAWMKSDKTRVSTLNPTKPRMSDSGA